MPGHGKGRAFLEWPCDPTLDMTEVPGLDDLHSPDGVIAQAEARAAHAFGAEKTFFLVQGATVGLQALSLAFLREGDEIILPRHSHRSIFGGLVLSGARPSYLPSICEEVTGLPVGTDLSALDSIGKKGTDNVKALLALRPTYWGTVEDLEGWVKKAQAWKKPLWVDEAHGAAFSFSSALPSTALQQGAQAVVQGSHKTLPVLTQGAMLHLGKDGALHSKVCHKKAELVRKALTILQTTSPSYLLLSSLDLARARMEEEGEFLWQKTVERAAFLRHRLNRVKGIYCWGEEVKAYPTVTEWDPTKLLVVLKESYLTGYQLQKLLREKWAIEAELAGPNYLLFLLSPFDHPENDQALLEAFQSLHFFTEGIIERESREVVSRLFHQGQQEGIEVLCTPREAFLASRRLVSFEEALHQISAQFICPYPPGIPLVAPGELITPALWEVVRELRRMGVHWQGAYDGQLHKIAVVDI
ncbi:arginine decarboxylase [Heliorestis convoluta]|uniref:Arginine decarboxylase n=2 Tax=Heliorestis convoluta TaxID=356322 RepID=A0A5Q2N445_9FIRM|nr:arginine decarboxylase [Heliorestis convoluta]